MGVKVGVRTKVDLTAETPRGPGVRAKGMGK